MDDLDDSDDSDVDHIMRKVGKKWSGTITTEKKSKMKRLDENSTWVDSIVTGTLKSWKFSRGKYCRLDWTDVKNFLERLEFYRKNFLVFFNSFKSSVREQIISDNYCHIILIFWVTAPRGRVQNYYGTSDDMSCRA